MTGDAAVTSERIVIGGIGNVLLGDDGVGPYAISLLERRYCFPSSVEVVDFGTPGLDLLEQVAQARVLILVDAVENGAPPGTLTLYTGEDVLKHAPAPRLDPHSPALAATLAAARFLGVAPATFLLIGITPENLALGPVLSNSAIQGAEVAVDVVLQHLHQLDIAAEIRQVSSLPPPFWARELVQANEAPPGAESF